MRKPAVRVLLAAGLLASFLAKSAEAGVNRWTSFGPGGGPLAAYSIVADPSTPGTFYARTNAAILRSSDGGRSWTSIHHGLSQFPVTSLSLDPSTSRLYAGAGPILLLAQTSTVFTFRDERWENALNPRVFIAFQIFDTVFDPNPLHQSTTWYILGDTGITRVKTGGLELPRAVNAGLPNIRVRALAIDPSNPVILYAATNGGGIFKSVNAGELWTAASSGLTNADVGVLTIDPSDPRTIYAGTNGGGVFKSDDGAATWRPINTGVTGSGAAVVHAISVARSMPESLYAATDGGIFKSVDGGESWTAVNAGLPNAKVFSVALDPSAPTTVFAGTEAGIFRSDDSGRAWTAALTATTGSFIRSLVMDPNDPATLYAGTEDAGVFKTDNGAVSWRSISSGLPKTAVLAVAINPKDPARLSVSTGNGIFRSGDGGESWTAANAGLTDQTIRALVTATSSPGTLFTATDGGVFRSTDDAATWTAINTDLKKTVTALAVDPADAATLYVGTLNGVVKLRQAADGGWTAGDPAPSLQVFAVAVDPSAPSTLYAGGGSSLFKSTDGGQTWALVGNGLPPFFSIRALAINPATRTIDVGLFGDDFAGGAFRSRDGGQTWTPLNTGLTDRGVFALAVAPSASGALYAGTFGGGVFDYESVSAESACAADSRTLCLNDGRFRVRVRWAVPSQGAGGDGSAAGVTGDTGTFWFFTPDNVELAVKVVDGRAFNGFFWVFHGALSDVEYTITATDTVTGAVRTYFNPASNLASSADTAAFFPVFRPGSAGMRDGDPASEKQAVAIPVGPLSSAASARSGSPACVNSPDALCLGGRFLVQVDMQVPSQNIAGAGRAVPLTADAGYFWFFSSDNVELVLKVLDGRTVNGNFWVFFGALTNVQYTVTVRDTLTDAIRIYFNPEGRFASVADTAAF